jgi:hypothetical protein
MKQLDLVYVGRMEPLHSRSSHRYMSTFKQILWGSEVCQLHLKLLIMGLQKYVQQ